MLAASRVALVSRPIALKTGRPGSGSDTYCTATYHVLFIKQSEDPSQIVNSAVAVTCLLPDEQIDCP